MLYDDLECLNTVGSDSYVGCCFLKVYRSKIARIYIVVFADSVKGDVVLVHRSA